MLFIRSVGKGHVAIVVPLPQKCLLFAMAYALRNDIRPVRICVASLVCLHYIKGRSGDLDLYFIYKYKDLFIFSPYFVSQLISTNVPEPLTQTSNIYLCLLTSS